MVYRCRKGGLKALSADNTQLKRQITWFKNQLFGGKYEKRVIENPVQPYSPDAYKRLESFCKGTYLAGIE
jgi:hypothetical protein